MRNKHRLKLANVPHFVRPSCVTAPRACGLRLPWPVVSCGVVSVYPSGSVPSASLPVPKRDARNSRVSVGLWPVLCYRCAPVPRFGGNTQTPQINTLPFVFFYSTNKNRKTIKYLPAFCLFADSYSFSGVLYAIVL